MIFWELLFFTDCSTIVICWTFVDVKKKLYEQADNLKTFRLLPSNRHTTFLTRHMRIIPTVMYFRKVQTISSEVYSQTHSIENTENRPPSLSPKVASHRYHQRHGRHQGTIGAKHANFASRVATENISTEYSSEFNEICLFRFTLELYCTKPH